LLDERGGVKLCDFGSAKIGIMKVDDLKKIPHLENEINKYTTLAYRAPEMVDLYQKKDITEKADIWVLFFLYLLCGYFTSLIGLIVLSLICLGFGMPIV